MDKVDSVPFCTVHMVFLVIKFYIIEDNRNCFEPLYLHTGKSLPSSLIPFIDVHVSSGSCTQCLFVGMVFPFAQFSQNFPNNNFSSHDLSVDPFSSRVISYCHSIQVVLLGDVKKDNAPKPLIRLTRSLEWQVQELSRQKSVESRT